MRSYFRRTALPVGLAISIGVLGACSSSNDATTTGTTPGSSAAAGATGAVKVSGSSTVQPISQLVAELQEDAGGKLSVTVDGPGTGDGFKLFCEGDTDISDASRPIKKTEAEACKAKGIDFIELKVAFDGLTVLTNPANSTVECLSKEDLYALVGPESRSFANWNDAQALAAELGSDTKFPSAKLDITAPGTESGTYDAFIELATQGTAEKRLAAGKIKKEDVTTVRPDYTSQSNDNAILQGIEGSNSSFGWVGFAFAEEAADKVHEIKIKNSKGECIAPTAETIEDGSYPLSRSLYIYVNKQKLDASPALKEYVDFYLGDGLKAVEEAGYIALPADQLAASKKVWEAKEIGTRDGGK